MAEGKEVEKSGSGGIFGNKDQSLRRAGLQQTLSPQRICLTTFEGKRSLDGTVVGQNGLVIQTEGAGKMTPITNCVELLGTLENKSPERIRESIESLHTNRFKLLLEVIEDDTVEYEKNKEPDTSDGTGVAGAE